MSIYAVLINDVALDLEDIEYDVRITHARSDIKAQPEASTAQVILRGATGTGVEIGDELRIGAYTGICRFRGTVTDLRLDHLSTTPAIPVVTVTAIGYLAKLGLLTTGESAYSKESPRARVDDVMADAGLDYLNGADDVLELASNNDPQIQPKLAYLDPRRMVRRHVFRRLSRPDHFRGLRDSRDRRQPRHMGKLHRGMVLLHPGLGSVPRHKRRPAAARIRHSLDPPMDQKPADPHKRRRNRIWQQQPLRAHRRRQYRAIWETRLRPEHRATRAYRRPGTRPADPYSSSQPAMESRPDLDSHGSADK